MGTQMIAVPAALNCLATKTKTRVETNSAGSSVNSDESGKPITSLMTQDEFHSTWAESILAIDSASAQDHF